MTRLDSKSIQLLVLSLASISLLLFLLHTLPLAPRSVISRHYGAGRHEGRRRLQAIVDEHCDGTLHHDLCVSTVASIPNFQSMSVPDIICHIINRTAAIVHNSEAKCSSYLRYQVRRLEPRQRFALADCLDMFDQTLDDLSSAYYGLESSDYQPDEHLTQIKGRTPRTPHGEQ